MPKLAALGHALPTVTPAAAIDSLFLLLLMLVAAALASYVPLAALAGVLVVVAWNMIEKGRVSAAAERWRSAAATFALTLIEDLSTGIVAGCVLAAVIWVLDAQSGRGAPTEMANPSPARPCASG